MAYACLLRPNVQATPLLFEVFARHRAEVDRFAALVRGDEAFDFVALSYPEHWADLGGVDVGPDWLPELRERYGVTI